MTPEELPYKLLALVVYNMGGQVSISREALDSMPQYNLVLDSSNPDRLELRIQSAEILLGKVEDDVVDVIV